MTGLHHRLRAVRREIEFIASASANSSISPLTINKPSGVVAGNLLVAVLIHGDTGVWTQLSGWTEATESDTNPTISIQYRVAEASDGASYSFECSNSKELTGVILAFRNAAFDVVGAFAESTSPVLAPSISVSFNNSVLLAVAGTTSSSVGFTFPTAMTSRFNSTGISGVDGAVASEPVNAGATGTRSISSTAGSITAALVAIKPG